MISIIKEKKYKIRQRGTENNFNIDLCIKFYATEMTVRQLTSRSYTHMHTTFYFIYFLFYLLQPSVVNIFNKVP